MSYDLSAFLSLTPARRAAVIEKAARSLAPRRPRGRALFDLLPPRAPDAPPVVWRQRDSYEGLMRARLGRRSKG